MAISTETWGPQNQRIVIDTTGSTQNSDAAAGPQALISAVDDGVTKVLNSPSAPAGIQPTILFKNPA